MSFNNEFINIIIPYDNARDKYFHQIVAQKKNIHRFGKYDLKKAFKTLQ